MMPSQLPISAPATISSVTQNSSVDEQALSARLAPAGDGWGQEQAGADPRHADPDDRRLDVHVAQEVERQDVVQRDAVEAAPVVVGVRHDRAGGDLQQQHDCDDQEILADPALAVGQRAEPRQHRVHRRIVGIVQPELVDEQHQAEARKVKQKLAQVQMKVFVVGVLPTSGS